MKQQIPKWRLEKIEFIRNGKIDDQFSGYELQKNGIAICKFSLDSLKELKEFFAELHIESFSEICNECENDNETT